MDWTRRGFAILGIALMALALALFVGATVLSFYTDECVFRGSDPEGSHSQSKETWWPPGSECVYRGPRGQLLRVEQGGQWAWTTWAVPGLAAIGLILALSSR